jgi:hypothetical protein
MVFLLIALYQLVRWIFGSIIWGFLSFVVRLCLSKLGGQIGQNLLDRLSEMTDTKIDSTPIPDELGAGSSSSSSSSSLKNNAIAEDAPSLQEVSRNQERVSAMRRKAEAQEQVKHDLQQLVPSFVTRANLTVVWDIWKVIWVGYLVLIIYYAISSQDTFCHDAKERYRRADRNSADYLASRRDVADCSSSSTVWRVFSYFIRHFDLLGGPFPILTKVVVPLVTMCLPGRTMAIFTIILIALVPVGYGGWILTSPGRRELVASIVRTKYTELLWLIHGWLSNRLKTKKRI